MKTYQIHLIRHAMTAENLEGRYIGHTDVPLCEDGIKQVEQMKEEMEYPSVDAVFTSPLSRCIDTAKLIYPDREPVVINELIEYDFGEFEGKTAEDLKDDEDFAEWLSGTNPRKAAPFGESNASFTYRVCACFEKIVDGIISSGVKSTAVVTHGGVVMALMAAYAIPEAPMHEWLTPNGTGYTLRIDPSIWMRGKKLEAFAECPSYPLTPEEQRALWDVYDE
ncbi:MAG: histidine phosphatase family protein [Clostridiales bacterium]|nr:histidine phosphatase family protein [Clostridia bacterium]MCR4563452.1 histidine phosphatase family protein [Clostridiales bacterium]